MLGIIETRVWLFIIIVLAALLLAQTAMAGVSITIGGSWSRHSRSGSSVIIGVGPGGYYGYPRGYLYPYGSGYRFSYGDRYGYPYYYGYGRSYPYYGPYYNPYQRQYPDWPDPRYQQPYKGYQAPRR